MGSNRKSKKRKRAEESDEESGVFAVELILKARVAEEALRKKPSQQWDYYVKWAGYDSDSNTWEPASNLTSCDRLLESFWDDVGRDNNDYGEGTILEPSNDWIATERKRFWQELLPHERERYSRNEEQRRAETKKRKALEAARAAKLPNPERSLSSSKNGGKLKKKNKKPRIIKSDSESDSDVPLAAQEKVKLKIPVKRRINKKPVSSDDEPLGKLDRRKSKALKISPLTESDHEETWQLKTRQEPNVVDSSGSPINKADKGKQKAAESSRPDSPSSLFSVDSSEEAVVLSPKTKSKSDPTPEYKIPAATLSTFVKSGSAKFSPAVQPKVPRNLLNPHNKLAETSTFNAPASGISTKQRLSQLALAPINPKEAKAKVLHTGISSNPLDTLRFRRNSSSNTTFASEESNVESSTTKPLELTLTALNASPINEHPSTDVLTGWASTMSPMTMDPHERLPFSPQLPSHSPTYAADDFLASLTDSLPGFAAPFESPTRLAADPVFEPKPPSALVTRKSSTIPKIPKKWKWEGQLFILRTNDEEELVGAVVCTNISTPKPRGMRIPLTFDAMDRLNFVSFYDLSDISTFLEACKTPDQFATLSASDKESSPRFKVIMDYMAKHEKVVLAPVWYEKKIVGHLLMFSATFKDLAKKLAVPPEIISQQMDGLIVSLHGWVLNPVSYSEESRLALSDVIPANVSVGPAFENRKRSEDGQPGPVFDWAVSLRNNFVLHLALRVLELPPDLYEWLNANFRQYAIYHEYERRDDRSEPTEHELLKTVLKWCQAQEWKYHDSKKEYRLRIVFVHVGSIRNFHRSPLTQKRISLDIRFYSYGTDGNVPRYMWGIREIYPIGGVVTLYPSAFTDDYVGTIRLIRSINDHPLWMSYISPSCLGYLANHVCNGQDPLAVYERQGAELAHWTLLDLIADGEIALISSPPESMTPPEAMKSWIHNNCRTIGPLDALSIGTAAFNSICANVHKRDWPGVIHQSINRDIVAVQRHPAILYEYRRFVIIRGKKDQNATPISVETATPCRFNFQDDYFKRKS